MPELKGKVELVDDTQNEVNNGGNKDFDGAASGGAEEKQCETTPLVIKGKPVKKQEGILETHATMTTFIPNETTFASEAPFDKSPTNLTTQGKTILNTSCIFLLM